MEDIDSAFRRRLRFIIEFPFPTPLERMEMWRRAFPPQVPTQGLDIEKLAQLNATGASIRNIALSTTFLAAVANKPVTMSHLLDATRQEMKKIGRSLTAKDIEDWV